MIDPSPERVTWYYGEWQSAYENFDIPNLYLEEGLPTSFDASKRNIKKLFTKCKYLSKHKHLPNGVMKWRIAQDNYMLAIQQFVNAREQNIIESGDCSAFYKYVNLRRIHREGVAPLVNKHGNLATSNNETAEVLNRVVPAMNGHPRDQAKVSVHGRWPLVRETGGQMKDTT